MKLKGSLMAALMGLFLPAAHGFTLDFASLPDGTSFPPNLSVTIPGYGNVTLYAGKDGTNTTTPVQLGTTYGAKALEFEHGDVFYVQFNGAAVSDFTPVATGIDGTELFVENHSADNTRYRVVLNGTGAGGAALTGISFTAATTAVPEPGSAMLGLIGVTGFLARRRR